MTIVFVLTMPNVGSWNGKWSGEGRLYCCFRKVSKTKAAELLAKRYWHYSWSDGWGAGIEARQVTPAEARRMRKESKGFNGYEWMVDTIIYYGKPMADHEVKEFLAKRQEAMTA